MLSPEVLLRREIVMRSAAKLEILYVVRAAVREGHAMVNLEPRCLGATSSVVIHIAATALRPELLNLAFAAKARTIEVFSAPLAIEVRAEEQQAGQVELDGSWL